MRAFCELRLNVVDVYDHLRGRRLFCVEKNVGRTQSDRFRLQPTLEGVKRGIGLLWCVALCIQQVICYLQVRKNGLILQGPRRRQLRMEFGGKNIRSGRRASPWCIQEMDVDTLDGGVVYNTCSRSNPRHSEGYRQKCRTNGYIISQNPSVGDSVCYR